jgi:phage terminase large subunit-like protein
MTAFTAANIARWRVDPAAFIEELLVNSATGRPFRLTDAQRRFLAHAFELREDGRMRYPELLFSAPKKSGKSGLAAMITLYVIVVLGGRFGEAYCVANDFEQAQGRVFQAIRRIVEASPALAGEAIVTANKITFLATRATIAAIASDYAGAAGTNPAIAVFDELWGVTTERGHRLFDEMVPPPTRKAACRLTVTYAGFEGESALLESLYKRGVKGKKIGPDLFAQPGMLTFWTHDFTAPWQTEEWRGEMGAQLRPNQYLRLVENRWVTSESTFIEMSWFDECATGTPAPFHDRSIPVWVGVDASVKHDSTAVVAVTYDREAKKVRLVFHKVFQPSPSEPLDFERTIEETLFHLTRRYRVREVRYDPYQMAAISQRLAAQGVPMCEFPQTTGNLTEASSNLFKLFKGRNIVLYPDDGVRLAVQRSVAVETPRGWRIAKDKASHKIDVVVALGMAALGAVQGGMKMMPIEVSDECLAMFGPLGERAAAQQARERELRCGGGYFSGHYGGVCTPVNRWGY